MITLYLNQKNCLQTCSKWSIYFKLWNREKIQQWETASKLHTKMFLVGLYVREEDDLMNTPSDWRLAVDTVSSPAARDVAVNEAIVKIEMTVDIVGIESAHFVHNISYMQRLTDMNERKRDLSLWRKCKYLNAYSATLAGHLMVDYDFQQHRLLHFQGH